MEFILLVLLIILVPLIIALVILMSEKSTTKTLATVGEGGSPPFSIGNYVAGLQTSVKPMGTVRCSVTENEFLFISSPLSGTGIIGRIPRDSVNKIVVESQTHITQRLSGIDIALLGPFAFSMPRQQKHKTQCLVIDWEDNKGIRQLAIFDSERPAFLQEAAAILNKYVKPKVVRLKDDEKKCPYCAENIKLESMKCRFCGSSFDGEELAAQIEARHKEIELREREEKIKAGNKECPTCGLLEVRSAFIEDGGMGDYCHNCKKSLKSMGYT